jgi:signal transduction histidine kinase
VLADVDRLERILLNLLTNAQKYSEPGAFIIIRAEHTDTRIVIAVIDRGPGIPPHALPHLFERFYRAPDGRKADGIGLGLYISRLLVEAHGGAIRAESTPGEGSVFTVTLPAAE